MSATLNNRWKIKPAINHQHQISAFYGLLQSLALVNTNLMIQNFLFYQRSKDAENAFKDNITCLDIPPDLTYQLLFC